MKAALIDRTIVIWLASALVVWTCCLVVLWGWAFDTSGGSALMTLAATLLAVCLASGVPGRVVRLTRRVLSWLNFGDSLAIALSADGPKRSRPGEARAMMRLLAGVAIGAIVGGLASTAAIFLARGLAERLTEEVLFSPAAWAVCKLVIQFVGMFPLAAGAGLLFLASAMVRAGSGRDVYASVFREWVWSLAIGVGVFAACRQFGVNLLALAGIMALAMLGGAAAIFQRQVPSVRPGVVRRPIEAPGLGRQLGVLGTFAAVALAGQLQLRLLTDVVGIGQVGRACWIAISAGLVCIALRRTDRKSRPPGGGQRIGATIGVVAAGLLQAALVIAAADCGNAKFICYALAAACQVPMTALAGVIVSRQRRLFAYAGGRARGYLCYSTGGAGLALLCYLLAAAVPSDSSIMPTAVLAMLVAALGLCAAGVLGGILLAKRAREQLRWSATGVVLMCAVTAGLLGTINQVTIRIGPASPGAWLTAVGQQRGGGKVVQGYLPDPALWRGETIDQALLGILAAGKGRWLAAAGAMADLPASVPAGVHLFVCSPDPTALRPGAWEDPLIVGIEGDFFSVGHLQRQRYDGVLLSLLPAEHPDAWRCYNERAVEMLVKCLTPGGPAVLRIQADDGGMAVALAAAATFADAIGRCWVAVENGHGRVDMLVAGPADRLDLPPPTPGRLLTTVGQLRYEWPQVARPLRVVQWNRTRRRAPSVRDFMDKLAGLQGG